MRGVAAGLAIVICAKSGAQLLTGQSPGDAIRSVNLATNAVQAHTTPATLSQVSGMVADLASGGFVYWSNGTTLYRAGISGANLAPPSPATMPHTYSGLAFDWRRNILYGIRDSNSGGNSMFRLNFAIGSANNDSSFMHLGAAHISGIEYSAHRDAIYAVNDQSGWFNGRGLYRLRPGNTPIFVAPYPAGYFDIDGLAIFGDNAYMVTNRTPSINLPIAVINLRNGALVGSIMNPNNLFAGSADVCGASIVPAFGGKRVVRGVLSLGDAVNVLSGAREIYYSITQGMQTVASGSVLTASVSQAYEVMVDAALTGSITVRFGGGNFLEQVATTTLAAGSSVTTCNLLLRNGDADDSGEVDATDIDIVISEFGATWPTPGTGNPLADLNGDGEVDATDIDIAIVNFGAIDD